jgi:GNAT superfamily N-acetyltransferase
MATSIDRHRTRDGRGTPEHGSIRLRELTGAEFDVLDTVFEGLSPASRYRRFHGATPRLSPRVRDRLVAVDGRTHIAVAAFAGAEPVGIARIVAPDDGPAELAVEVVDEWQHRGIGSRLVGTVAELGRAAGHRQLVASVLTENRDARRLLRTVFPPINSTQHGAEITYVVDLAADAAAPTQAA